MRKLSIALSTCVLLASYAIAAIVPTTRVTVDGYAYTDPYPAKIASTPIAGVKVYLQPQVYTVQSASAPNIPIVLIDSTFTDAAGHFAFDTVSANSYSITFQHPGNASRTIAVYAAKDTTLRVSLLASGAHGVVKGKVLAACRQSVLAMPCALTPLPKCTLTVSLGASIIYQPTAMYVPVGAVFTAVTDDSGNYSIDSIPLSSNNTGVSVTATKAGYVSQTIDTSLWNQMKTTVNFTLTPNSTLAGGDSVYTAPVQPTIKDSITYYFHDSDACCCAQFVNPMVSVSDTMVYLSFSVNTAPCQLCNCITAGKWYAFKGGALKPGKYGIYRAESMYCPPGTACPMIALLPVRIGEIVVRSSTSTVRPTASSNVLVNGMTLTQGKGTITMNYILNLPAHIRVKVFNARGMLAAEIDNRSASSGMHHFSWKATVGGVYFITLDINEVVVASRTLIISK